MPKVSVIIPTRNHEKFIKACIESILNQTFQDFEIVITDDASQDQTVEIIKGFREPRLQLFQLSEAMGVSVATNNCIKRSSGRYLAWMGPDSLWAPTKLEIQVRYLDEHPTTGAVFGKGD